jgi:hypothetical protein
MAWSWENAAGGAAVGAMAGAPLGPFGMAGGAVLGGVVGGAGGLGNITDNMTGQTSTHNMYAARESIHSGEQSRALRQVGEWGLTGTGPSAAQRLIEMNREQNAANMIGSAKSMPGGNPALANQVAAEGIARGNASATLQGAQMRSAEQQAMIGNYLTGIQAARETDAELYKTRLEANQKNTAGKQAFIGGIMSGGAGILGGAT